MTPTFAVYFDGACGPTNPGFYGGWGFWISDLHADKVVYEGFGGVYCECSNNVLEYQALKRALELLCTDNRTANPIRVYGDSQLVIKQMQGSWSIQRGLYVDIANKTLQVAEKFSDIQFNWIPREKNRKADLLSQMGLAKAHRKETREEIVGYE